ncbi:MAG: hypothetical protein K6E10_08475 [Eubacterium sp.]|nr:hypothetical protein [Eubacterium sp.]
MIRLKRLGSLLLAGAFTVTGIIGGSGLSVNASDGSWLNTSDGWKYQVDGETKTGWFEDGDTWYYSNDNGIMQTGWVNAGGTWYYMDSSGAMVTGWVNAGGTWYYMNSSGAMATGWEKIDGYWYYFDESGLMQTGWIDAGGTWYYMNSSGDMQQGWLSDGGSYYYCDRSSGAMQAGVKVNGINLDSSGVAENTSYSAEKIPVMIRANEVVKSICNPDDSLESKQNACYTWVAEFPYMLRDYPIGTYYNSGKWSCYDAHYADNILNSKGELEQPGAECVGEAAALAYLFNELNFGTVYLDHSDVHGWVEVNDRFWDPLNQESKKNGKNWLNIAPSEYEMSSGYHWVEI